MSFLIPKKKNHTPNSFSNLNLEGIETHEDVAPQSAPGFHNRYEHSSPNFLHYPTTSFFPNFLQESEVEENPSENLNPHEEGSSPERSREDFTVFAGQPISPIEGKRNRMEREIMTAGPPFDDMRGGTKRRRATINEELEVESFAYPVEQVIGEESKEIRSNSIEISEGKVHPLQKRWVNEEHQRFEQALERPESRTEKRQIRWKFVSNIVGTKSAPQCRNHYSKLVLTKQRRAQKFTFALSPMVTRRFSDIGVVYSPHIEPTAPLVPPFSPGRNILGTPAIPLQPPLEENNFLHFTAEDGEQFTMPQDLYQMVNLTYKFRNQLQNPPQETAIPVLDISMCCDLANLVGKPQTDANKQFLRTNSISSTSTAFSSPTIADPGIEDAEVDEAKFKKLKGINAKYQQNFE